MKLFFKILKAIKWYSKKIYLYFFLKSIDGLEIQKNTKFKGIPILKNRGGKILIGENVVLNSENEYYFINMHSPIKLIVNDGARVIIGNNSRLHGVCINAYEKIEIGENCLIAANCQIIDSNRHELCFENPQNRLKNSSNTNPVKIEDNVWVGANVLILPGVKIGEGSVIAAGSVVTKCIPPYTLAGGNPAKVIKTHMVKNTD